LVRPCVLYPGRNMLNDMRPGGRRQRLSRKPRRQYIHISRTAQAGAVHLAAPPGRTCFTHATLPAAQSPSPEPLPGLAARCVTSVCLRSAGHARQSATLLLSAKRMRKPRRQRAGAAPPGTPGTLISTPGRNHLCADPTRPSTRRSHGQSRSPGHPRSARRAL
jgi:hypothetical protein